MKKITALTSATLLASAAAFADPSGTWQSEEGNDGGYIHVTIGLCGDDSGDYCGTIVDVFENDNTTIVGEPIITSMEDRGNGNYRGGRIWAPDEDKWYTSKMKLDGDTLTVSGCVAGGLICRGQDWTRVQ